MLQVSFSLGYCLIDFIHRNLRTVNTAHDSNLRWLTVGFLSLALKKVGYKDGSERCSYNLFTYEHQYRGCMTVENWSLFFLCTLLRR